MCTDPGFTRDLLARVVEEVLAPWIACLRRHFPRSTKISGVDAAASPPIVNLTLLRDWVASSIPRIRELCGPGVAVANWAGERYLKQPEEMLDLKRLVGPGPLLG